LLEGSPRRASTPDVSTLVDYLLANRGAVPFLVGTIRASTAAPIILAIGEPVMALGGFSGGDQILSVDDLEEWVAAGAVRFFLASSQGGPQRDLIEWIATYCAPVPPEQWQPAMPGPGGPPNSGPGGMPQLFDCHAE
jgi:hypothetical protein